MQGDLPEEATRLPLRRQLVGNLDEVTDVRLLTPHDADSPSSVAVATNSPDVMLFDLATLSCAHTLRGHADIVLALEAAQGAVSASGQALLASGGKDAQVGAMWAPACTCMPD